MSKAITLNLAFKNETKSCYRFEAGEGKDAISIYLKKTQVDAAGIDPEKGITVNIEETK